MSIKKSANVEKIFEALKIHYNLATDRDLANFIAVDFRTLAAWKARGNIAKPDVILYKCSGVRYEWLKTGEGEMFTSPLVAEASPAYGVTQTIQGLTPEETELIRIARECPEVAAVVRMMGSVDCDTQKDIQRNAEKEKRMHDALKELKDKKAG